VILTTPTIRIKSSRLPNSAVRRNSLSVFPKVSRPILIVPFVTTILAFPRVPKHFSDGQWISAVYAILVACDPQVLRHSVVVRCSGLLCKLYTPLLSLNSCSEVFWPEPAPSCEPSLPSPKLVSYCLTSQAHLWIPQLSMVEPFQFSLLFILLYPLVDLFERLRNLRGNKTMLFSSHRFGNLTRHADLIL